jgi:hypothetical protein
MRVPGFAPEEKCARWARQKLLDESHFAPSPCDRTRINSPVRFYLSAKKWTSNSEMDGAKEVKAPPGKIRTFRVVVVERMRSFGAGPDVTKEGMSLRLIV